MPSRWRSRRSCVRAGSPRGSELDPVAEVERRVRLRALEEAGVDAVERVAVAVVRALHGRPAAADRIAGHLDSAEAVARALGLVEHIDVDLDAEDLVHAAHVAAPSLLVVVEIEVRAAGGDAAGRVHHAVAEGAALPAFAAGYRARLRCHRASLARPDGSRLLPRRRRVEDH